MHPPVRAIANLLADAAPTELERLRKQFPDQRELFETFYELGDEPRQAALSDRQLEALRAFIEAGLAAAEGKLGGLIKALTDRIRRARMTKLAGAIVASVSGRRLAREGVEPEHGCLRIYDTDDQWTVAFPTGWNTCARCSQSTNVTGHPRGLERVHRGLA